MNHKWKALLLSAALGAVTLLTTACGGISPELKALQGHWVDINSDATLDFSGNKMIFTDYSPEEFTVKVEKHQVVNAADDRYQFGLMGALDICSDGSLSGYEQILDAEGHTYRFVREEDKVKALEIRDYSTDMPKVIHSGTITEFELHFKKDNRQDYGLNEDWPRGYYHWEIELEEDGSYEMEFDCMGDSYVALRFEERVDSEYVAELAQLIQELNIPERNGYDMSNEVSKPGYSLHVTYDSGEELRVRAEGDAAVTCVFDIPTLLAHAAKQVRLK